jgi:dGTPase
MERKLKEYYNSLAHLKTNDKAALRRDLPENDDDNYMFSFGSPYLIDAQHKILPSKAIRRLDSKTQVLTGILNKHVRTRLSHTYEVISFAVLAARILGLNENLCYAIALSHDIGHPPLGHNTEKFISTISGKTFRHEIFAVVIAQKIERKGNGLNLTYQVLEGILNHSRGSDSLFLPEKSTPEANLAMYADKIAYIFADINNIFPKPSSIIFPIFQNLKN